MSASREPEDTARYRDWMRRRRKLGVTTIVAAAIVGACRTSRPIEMRVGDVDGGGTFLTTGQRVRPVGDVLRFAGRPVDLALSPDGRFAFVKEIDALLLV